MENELKYIKIKRLRKQQFTEKRSPYKRYLNATWEWSTIFEEIELLKEKNDKNFIKFTANKYGIKYKTLKNKYCNYCDSNKNKINDENRGGTNFIFNEEDERNIVNFLKINFIDKQRMLCDEIIKLYAIDKCLELYPDKKFNASNGWCYMFKKKWNLSTVRCTISKIATTVYSKDEINFFIRQCLEALLFNGSELVFNLDQTKWRNINVSPTTIHFKGTDNAQIKINGNDKAGFTVTLIISADGKKLKPIITVKGKTNKCLEKYNLNNDVIGTYSNNGWVNCGVIKIALDEIFAISKGKKCTLILDSFPSHRDNFIKNYAQEKNIKLIYVPIGMTYKYQPLDVMINGILKKKAKMIWRKEIIKNPDMKITDADAVKYFLQVYNEINAYNIAKSFIKSCFVKFL